MNDFAGHTPGPWRIEMQDNYMRLYFPRLLFTGDVARGYVGRANAELIAAAPDLLAERDELLEALQKAKQLATQIQECSIKLDKVYLYADKIKALQEDSDD